MTHTSAVDAGALCQTERCKRSAGGAKWRQARSGEAIKAVKAQAAQLCEAWQACCNAHVAEQNAVCETQLCQPR